MKNKELFDFEKIKNYRGHIINTGNEKIEKFDKNKRLSKNFNNLLFKAATTRFPENGKKCD